MRNSWDSGNNALGQINIDITVGSVSRRASTNRALWLCWGRPCHPRGQGPGFVLSSGTSRQCQIWSNCRRRLNIRGNGQRALPSPWIGQDDSQLNSRLRTSSSRLWWDPTKIGSLRSGFFLTGPESSVYACVLSRLRLANGPIRHWTSQWSEPRNPLPALRWRRGLGVDLGLCPHPCQCVQTEECLGPGSKLGSPAAKRLPCVGEWGSRCKGRQGQRSFRQHPRGSC